ncbi:hypothetical protein EVAR_59502_1 [Eumeta japonica]|uniref:Uncharacterized protein n=1 Tax=Eumeta variegata TaxID=151549 RepID=A0A4C1YJI2_EUMVA|nr:hypothetical protein EVAR_59502_1 [Eumeta japonica]
MEMNYKRVFNPSSGCSSVAIGRLRSSPLGHPFILVCYCVSVFLRAAFRSVELRAYEGAVVRCKSCGGKLRLPCRLYAEPHTVSAPREAPGYSCACGLEPLGSKQGFVLRRTLPSRITRSSYLGLPLETIVTEVTVSEKNSSEYLRRNVELTTFEQLTSRYRAAQPSTRCCNSYSRD